jgi:penicillin amidase/acyl-homoserine-lactone acylase
LKLDAQALLAAAKERDVRILRDTWGVPHIFGTTDADAAFGLGYAHSEDDFGTIQDTLLADRGELSSVKGRQAASLDYLLHLFRVRELVDEKYEKDLSPEARAVCDAYAEGVNLYAALHPKDVVKNDLFPATGKDVVAGFVLKVPFFFLLDRTVREIFEPDRKRSVSTKSPTTAMEAFFIQGAEIGSNAFAVAPHRTADGFTRLAVNSHQPWTGPVTWYEAHLHSEAGMDITGGTFPGSPIILHGQNRNLGWAHTVNRPDLADIYVLEINPDNPNQYKFDGQWRDLEVSKVRITVRVFGPIRWTVEREVLGSVYGPAVRRPHGVYAIRYAGYGDIRTVEQWYRMGKARNFEEWLEAMKMRAIPSLNVVYADREGNIYYLYNALLPLRAEGYDWKQYLPGNTSETLWKEFLPFEKLPQIKNPASGFVISCNNTPFRVTVGPENPKPEEYSATLGIETRMTNRALRALELFGADDSITEEEFYAYKYDVSYSKNSQAAELLRKILDAPRSDDPVVNEAVNVLHAWDLRTDLENRAAAIAVLTMEPVVRAELFGGLAPDLIATLKEKAHLLKDAYGRIDVPWGEVNRIRRGTVDVGTSGAPDVLHAIYGAWQNGKLIGYDGDSYILIASWDRDGKVSSRSIHQFGSATLDEKSPHYADQLPLFVACKTKPVWLDEAEIRAHLEREYRPGEEPAPPGLSTLEP